MEITVFDSYGRVYDVLRDWVTAQSIARAIGGYCIDDEGNRF